MSEWRVKGIVPATFTPFGQDGELDLDKIPGYAEYLSRNSIGCIYANGSTGEGTSLTVLERKKVAEKWIEECHKRSIKVIVQVGCLNLRDSCDLARHAQDARADAISTLPPLYFKPKTIELLIDYCREVSMSAPKMPFYYYHLPTYTGVNFEMEEFLTKATPRIPRLCGVKFSWTDQADLLGCVSFEDGKMNILFGSDQQLLPALATGVDGAIGSTYNFMPQPFHRLIKAFHDKDIELARHEQNQARQVIKVMLKFGDQLGGPLAAFKCAMSLIGQDQGPPREPFLQASDSVTQTMKSELEKIGFFEFIK